MSDYWISFRITLDNEASYQRRYKALIDTINSHTYLVWESDTSMIAFRSESTIDEIGQDLKAALNKTDDHLVIRQIDYISTRYINDPGPGFTDFFPLAKKL